MKPVFLSRWLCVFGLLLAASLPSSADVLKIVVNDAIHPITQEYIERALAQADRDKDQALLIELNTPGGLLESTRNIIEKILASPVPVIIYVTPGGSRAASAGFFILESADVAAMAPGTNTGAAHPVTLGGGKVDDVMKEKMENDAAALMRSVVSKRGRNVEVAESTVRQSKSFTEQEALTQKLIDYVAPSEQNLLQQMQGKIVKRFDGKTITLNLENEPIRPFDMTLKQRILAFIMDPNIAFILLAIGGLSLYAEFNHPGAVVPGTVGVVFILLAVFALNLLPVRFAAVVLIFASFALFALEAKFAAHGVLAIGGMVTMVLGGLLLVDAPIPEMRVHLLTALAVSIPLGGITVFLMSIALKARANKVVTGAQGLVGEIGIAQTALSPRGKIFVHGEIWDATSASGVPAGQTVVVLGVDGLQLRVEPSTVAQQVPSSQYRLSIALASCEAPPSPWRCRILKHVAVQSATEAFLTFRRGGFGWVLSFTGIVIIVVVLYFLSSIKILAEYERGVIFRLGRLLADAKGPGLIFVFAPLDRMVRVSLRQEAMEVPPQDIITRDNVTLKVNAVIFLRVIEPRKAVVEVSNYVYQTSQFAQTTLRSVLGEQELDELLSHREKINLRLQSILDTHTAPWGVKVTNVEVKQVDMPETMLRAMAKQAEAEREKRSKIIHAEGEFSAAQRLVDAAALLATEPVSVQLRYLQTLTEIGVEKNTTVIFPVPVDFFSGLQKMLGKPDGSKS